MAAATTLAWRRLVLAGALSGALVTGLFALAKWMRETSDWPTAKSDNILLIGILVIGLIPIELLLIDAFIRRGGKLSFQGVTIDLAAAGPAPADFRIDTNIGITGKTVNDSSSVAILDALRKAAKTDIVVLDLENGKAWWETRLLVLLAGAVRTGKPRAIVFVTSERGQSRAFLGWAAPKSLLDALFDASNPRHTLYLTAYALALDAGEKWQEEINKLDKMPSGSAPAIPTGLTMGPWNWSFIAWSDGRANPFATEQFLAVKLGQEVEETWRASPFPADPQPSTAEKFPHAVTISEETVLSRFGSHVHRTAIEESARQEEQVSAFLLDSGEFVAITRGASYVRLARRSVILEGLVQQLLNNSLRDSS